MNTYVWGQLRMERRGHHATLTHEHGHILMPCENLDPFTNSFHTRGPNEHRMEIPREAHHAEITFEAVDLTAIGIAAHIDVEGGKRALIRSCVIDLLRKQDHSRTRAEDGHVVTQTLGNRVEQLRRRQ